VGEDADTELLAEEEREEDAAHANTAVDIKPYPKNYNIHKYYK
jgi:hypothetical protein